MDLSKVILKALSLKGVQEFFIVQDENGDVDWEQVLASVIQLLLVGSLLALIGYFYF